MWPFQLLRRRPQVLGAAVTAIPSLVRTIPAPAYVAPTAVPESAVVPEPAWVSEPAWVPEPAPAPRVELGFRDGSTAALAPGSEQAKALSDIADVLTRKDGAATAGNEPLRASEARGSGKA